MRHFFLLLAACLLTAAAPATTSAAPTRAAVHDAVRFIRFSVIKRRGGANSIQVADVRMLNTTGEVVPWPLGTQVTSKGVSPPGEGPENLIDNDPQTKWLAFDFAPGYSDTIGVASVTFQLPTGVTGVSALQFRTANDFPERDPVATRFETSADGVDWDSGDFIEVESPPIAARLSWSPVLVATASSLPTPAPTPVPTVSMSSCRPGTELATSPSAPVTGQLATVRVFTVTSQPPALAGASAAVVSEVRRTSGICMGFVYEYRFSAGTRWVAQWATTATTYRQSSAPTITSAYKTRRGAVLRVQSEAARLGR